MTTTKDIIEAVRAVQERACSYEYDAPFSAVRTSSITYDVWDVDGLAFAENLDKRSAHALANLLNLQLPETAE